MLKIKSHRQEISDILRNKDFLSTSLNQGWAIIAGPLALIFIPLFLTRELQGYYYAFISVSALSILADLGFSTIILQFAAHEFAFLSKNGKRFSFDNNANEIHLKKLASLFMFSVKWTLRLIIVSYPAIFIIGYFLFNRKGDDVTWLIPWILFSTGSAIGFFNGILLSFLEGCDMVSRIQRIRFYNTMIFSVVVLAGLACRFNLYALALASLISSMFTLFLLGISFRKVFAQLFEQSRRFVYKWKDEILKLFWKYIISYSSSYLIFQIYTPLAFRFHGAEEAGRVGFSIAVWTAVISLANIWIVSVLPKINFLVAVKNWKDLDKLVLRRFLAGEMTLILTGILFFVVYFVISGYFPIAGRFTSVNNLVILFVIWAVQFVINAMTTYLRAHKEEPFYYIFLCSALYIVIVTYFCTRFFSPAFTFIGFITANFLFFPWYFAVFRKHRQLWHGKHETNT